MKPHALAGEPAPPSMLVNVPRLVSAYYTRTPDTSDPRQRVRFGTSGHRGSAFEGTFNEAHVVAITQAICDYRREARIDGPLFLGMDTHALSVPAHATALEVLAANRVETMVAARDDYTPTPAVSHAIVAYNRGRTGPIADGIVVTPSHNPPEDGGFKYNPPHGGPAETEITRRIADLANTYLDANLRGVRRVPHDMARRAPTTHQHDFIAAYTRDLASVIDVDAIRHVDISIGVDPLGGAGIGYWPRIAERYSLNLTVVNEVVDPAFGFMPLDWDGRIRMDPSSPYAMRGLLARKDDFRVALACDTDHDRHGVVTPHAGLLPPNDYLTAVVLYLFSHRPHWSQNVGLGKTVVTSRMLDRVAARLGRKVCEVPVGFKWFVQGLREGRLAFAGEESAGATFARRDGTAWTTDKDGVVTALLAAEITARLGRDPGEVYRDLTGELGAPAYARRDAPATPQQKALLQRLDANQVHLRDLAGERVERVLTRAPGNGAPIDGIKVETASAWFAARPSGTEELYKIYAESFLGPDHLHRVLDQAQAVVDRALDATAAAGDR